MTCHTQHMWKHHQPLDSNIVLFQSSSLRWRVEGGANEQGRDAREVQQPDHSQLDTFYLASKPSQQLEDVHSEGGHRNSSEA